MAITGADIAAWINGRPVCRECQNELDDYPTDNMVSIGPVGVPGGYAPPACCFCGAVKATFVRTSRTFHRRGCKALNPSMCGGIGRKGIWDWPDHEMGADFEPIAFGRQIVVRGWRSVTPWPCRVCLPECWQGQARRRRG
jgi:hypothetical protein